MGKKSAFYVLLLCCLLSSPVLAAETEGRTQAEIGFSEGTHTKIEKQIRLPQTSEQVEHLRVIGMTIVVSSVIGIYRRISQSAHKSR